jgi:uncharacterized membrane protein YdjX (TVP38/TMEM64 family)
LSTQPQQSLPSASQRNWWILCLVLAIPIIPFLLWGSAIEDWLMTYREHPPATWVLSLCIIGLLASDVLLPIPSSLLCTLAGAQLGMWLAILISWTGMNLGACLGFAAAKAWGSRWVNRMTSADDISRIQPFAERYGSLLLLLARGVPVLAEASVLWLGMHQLSWSQFWWPVLGGNLVLAVVYCTLGEIAAEQEWLPIALVASLALPILLLGLWRRWQTK